MKISKYKMEEQNAEKLVEWERNRLRLLLGGEDKYNVAYLGGGDFLVHVMGIDPQMDRIIKEVISE
ncbi:MAG: hypothetical protein WC975_07330 [Phycisphaerae bacterium]